MRIAPRGSAGGGELSEKALLVRLARWILVALIVSLPLMKFGFRLGDYWVTATDGLFLLCAAMFAGAVARGEARIPWSPAYPILLIYFAALFLSALASADPGASGAKLLTQLYLIGLPVLTLSLIQDLPSLKLALTSWLAATAIPAALGVLTVAAFYAGFDRQILDYALHPFGTLPPGNYPRVEATFIFPAMLCNYLTVSVMILLPLQYHGWIGRKAFALLLGAILITALFTLTPGLGGLALTIGLWTYLVSRSIAGRVALIAGVSAAAVSLMASVVTPILHSTAPFSVDVPLLDLHLAPAVRWMTWTAAAASFSQHPWLGTGIGAPAIAVEYLDPSGALHVLSDAHNVVLNIAAQSGLIGLAALIVLILWVAIRTMPPRLGRDSAIRLALGLAWLNGFVFQGLTASFEDARHLWVLLGLFLAGIQLRADEPIAGADTQGRAANSG